MGRPFRYYPQSPPRRTARRRSPPPLRQCAPPPFLHPPSPFGSHSSRLLLLVRLVCLGRSSLRSPLSPHRSDLRSLASRPSPPFRRLPDPPRLHFLLHARPALWSLKFPEFSLTRSSHTCIVLSRYFRAFDSRRQLPCWLFCFSDDLICAWPEAPLSITGTRLHRFCANLKSFGINTCTANPQVLHLKDLRKS